MYKSLLRFLIFCHVERQSALTRSHISQCIAICFPFQQEVNNLRITVVRSVMKCGPRSFILCIDVRTVLQEHLHSIVGSLLASHMQRGALLIIELFELSMSHEQSCNQFDVVLHSCHMQRCSLLV